METILGQMQIRINPKIFLKDPEDSELGKKILNEGHKMMNEMGFENFTFKKLANRLNTTESSIYRYFESKHHFLIYLLNWYWSYLDYAIVFTTLNVSPSEEKLKKAIDILCQTDNKTRIVGTFDIKKLQRIAINESAKAYLVNEVDKKNKEGFYLAYKRLCKRLAQIITEFSPSYLFSSSLSVTLVESISQQKYYLEHLPSLSSFKKANPVFADFFFQLAKSTLSKK
ncbi:MAG: TetR/AcrR family transcriptional regulator [Bacteroidota bacterium]|jgi:AcrR family transcriptional regulator